MITKDMVALIATSKVLSEFDIERTKRLIDVANSLGYKFICIGQLWVDYLNSIGAVFTIYSTKSNTVYQTRVFRDQVELATFACYNSDYLIHCGESKLVNLILETRRTLAKLVY